MVAAVQVTAEDILRALQTPEMRAAGRDWLWDIFGWWLGPQALRRLEHLLSDEFYPRVVLLPELVGTRAKFGAHYKPAVVAPETTVTLPVVPPLQPHAGAETLGTILTATGKEEVATPHIWADGITKEMARVLLRGYGREELVWGQGSLWANIGMLASDISALSLQTSTLDAIVRALKKQVDAFAQVQIPEVSARVVATFEFGAARWNIPDFFNKLIGNRVTDFGWTGDVSAWGTAISSLSRSVQAAIVNVLSHSAALESGTRSAIDALPNTVDDVVAGAQGFATQAVDAVRTGMQDVLDAVGNTTLRPIALSVKGTADGAASLVSSIVSMLENMIQASFGELGTAVGGVFQSSASECGIASGKFTDGGEVFNRLYSIVLDAADEFSFWFKAIGEFAAHIRVGTGEALSCRIRGRTYANHYRFFYYLNRTTRGSGCTNTFDDIRSMLARGYRVVYWYIRTWAPSIGTYLTGDAIPRMMEYAASALAGAINATVQLLSRAIADFANGLRTTLEGFTEQLRTFTAALASRVRGFRTTFEGITLPSIPDMTALGLRTTPEGLLTPDIFTLDRYIRTPVFTPPTVRLPTLPTLPALPAAPTLPENIDFTRVVRDP